MQIKITKMDKIWLTTAHLLHSIWPDNHIVTKNEIQNKYEELFQEGAPSSTLMHHLISCEPRNTDKNNPTRGGSRNRYLFKTSDGIYPDKKGDFRLYKFSDAQFDSSDKTGPSYPEKSNIPKQFHYLIDWYLDSYFQSIDFFETEHEKRFIAAETSEKNIASSNLPLTEKVSLVKARRGQGIFKKRVAKIEFDGCRLTGVKMQNFLIASHIKPWADSNNYEKLDGHNGLLLAPHVDWLFDQGYITFTTNGTVIIASEAHDVFLNWKLINPTPRPLTEQQEAYMQYHRENIFRDDI